MPTISFNKTGQVATGVKVQTQFDMESSEKLFEITGPKTLEWNYSIAANKIDALGGPIIQEHVEKVQAYLKGNWRSKFKKNVKAKVVKEMKFLEKEYKKKSEAAKKDVKDHFSKAASAKAEAIIADEFSSFMDTVSAKCISDMGTKGKKLKAAGKKVAIGGAVVGVTVVGIVSTVATMGVAGAVAVPALAIVGMSLSGLSATGTLIKSFVSARKEFRSAQDKLSKTTGGAIQAVDAALKDANALKQKYDKMVLRMNEMGVKIEKLDAEVNKLKSVKIDDPKAKKLAEKSVGIRDKMMADLLKLEGVASDDPRALVTALEKVKKSLKDDVDIDARIAKHGRMEGLFSKSSNAGGLSTAIAGL